MGWFLAGATLGWLACTLYHYSQVENDKVTSGAFIVFASLMVFTIIVAINIGIAGGTIPAQAPTEVLGR
jgi:cell division protein FtsW (lipid II flippase)